MENELELLIVIINYKTPSLVIDCLESLRADLNESIQAVVVDNDSSDGSVDLIQRWLADQRVNYVSLIESAVNSGFSGGNNLGIRSKNADYYLLLNSDTIVRPGAIGKLLSAAEQYSEYGIVSPRLEWPDETPQISCFRFHNPFSELIHGAGTSLVTRIFRSYNVPLEFEDSISFPEWTSFACVLIKKAVFDDVGLMDEGYFLYYEDSDFCREAAKRGWGVVNDPRAKVVHLRGGSGNVKENTKSFSRQPKYFYASRSRYYAKHYGIFGLFIANSCWYLGRLIALFRLLGGTPVKVCEKQYLDNWINFFCPKDSSRNK